MNQNFSERLLDNELLTALTSKLSIGLNDFAESLDKRLRAKIFTTEDVVRYTFFAAITNALGLNPEHVVLEQPHPGISGARIDTWLLLPEERSVALEFKYDRPIPSQRNAPRTQKAGQLIKDIFRLAKLDPKQVEAIFVYLTTDEMAAYLHNPANGLSEIYELAPGSKLTINQDYFRDRAATFTTATGPTIPCVVETIVSRDLAGGHRLRAYSILPVI